MSTEIEFFIFLPLYMDQYSLCIVKQPVLHVRVRQSQARPVIYNVNQIFKWRKIVLRSF
jgi:hypothetical protein